jgi:hypothetical protein
MGDPVDGLTTRASVETLNKKIAKNLEILTHICY